MMKKVGTGCIAHIRCLTKGTTRGKDNNGGLFYIPVSHDHARLKNA